MKVNNISELTLETLQEKNENNLRYLKLKTFQFEVSKIYCVRSMSYVNKNLPGIRTI